MAYKKITIPIMPKIWPLPQRVTPITPGENLMLALSHKKPLWMPNFYASSQLYQSAIARDSPIERDRDAVDWFGVEYRYSAAQGSNTPQGNVLSDITAWEDTLVWHDLSQYDWAADGARLVRDPSLALFMRMSNGPFERLHMLMGFEQALIDLITEPETVRAFLERLVDFKIELFNRIRDHVPLDYIVGGDDYGTMRAPFFSTHTFEQTILKPTVRFVEAVHARGTKFVAHCCGKIDPFIPYLVEEIGVDGLEIQDLNDIPGILGKYGDRVTVEYHPDPKLVYDPETTGEMIRAHVREIVDRFGAQAVPGSGVIVSFGSNDAHIFYPMEDEFYHYSRSRYKDLV
jgi:uroporphyrinogen-III decarboxylase